MRSSLRLYCPVCVLALIVATGAAAQTELPPDDPLPLQQNIPQLTSLTSLATVLNLARGAVRIVGIVSPSSGTADDGLSAIKQVLADNPSRRLRVYVLLTRARADDTTARAIVTAARYREPRIIYLWDPDQIAANAFRATVGLASGPVHDVYFLFDTGATFTAAPPRPELWMQANPAIDGAPMDADSLRAETARLVERVERNASSRAMNAD
jgi:hypothetical protein